MAPSNLPSVFNATSQDIELLLAAQAHLGSKNLQVHMNSYLWKTRYAQPWTWCWCSLLSRSRLLTVSLQC